MNNSILIFTFSPIQSFIIEARRAADLYTGSQILVELAKAAAEAIGKKRLIYPALDENGNLPADIPNKLVAQVSFEDVEEIAKSARTALLKCWKEDLAQKARAAFEKEIAKHNLDSDEKNKIPPLDDGIWNRHVADDYLWETYWSASELDGRDYKEVYKEAEAGLAAAKFTRPFTQYSEEGFKDTLSGKREALHGKNQDGREYWIQVGQVEAITPIKIRLSIEDSGKVENGEKKKDGRPRERLDTAGVIKRFHPLAKKGINPFHGFPSTSSIAAWSFLKIAQTFAPELLKNHHEAIQALLPEEKYKIRDDEFWQYDGDLLYPETLHPKRMKDDYNKTLSKADLQHANYTLENLCKSLQQLRDELRKKKDPRYAEIFTHPSTYYAIIVLDGDDMGKYLSALDEAGHRDFSADLGKFSGQVSKIAEKYLARVIYNGGDDVLALAPLSTAFACAQELAQSFKSLTKRTASAGIAFAHHLSPLGTALRAARRAEHHAKELSPDKDALCILALKRSGEPIQVRTKWNETASFESVLTHFIKDEVSSRLPYDMARSAYALPDADVKFESDLRRLLKRHWQGEEKNESISKLSLSLTKWAESFPKIDSPSQTEELANWLALARFIAKGGQE